MFFGTYILPEYENISSHLHLKNKGRNRLECYNSNFLKWGSKMCSILGKFDTGISEKNQINLSTSNGGPGLYKGLPCVL